MAVKIGIANQKGGVGKTTTAIELGACMADRGYNVLVIDLEQQADVTKYMGADQNKPGTFEVLKGDINIHEAIQKVSEFDVLPSSNRISAIESDIDFAKPTAILKLKKICKEVDDDYDFIFMDNNPGKNSLLNMCYIASDYLIVPSDDDEGSVDQIQTVYDELKDLKDDEWTDAEVLGVLLTRAENTSVHTHAANTIEELIKRNESDAFFKIIRKGVAASEVKWEGSSMQHGKRRSSPAIDYRHVADEILVRLGELEE